ncbi:glycosyltransferase family 4 protein [Salinimicrobium catena]|uniref:glycosyltransferase family 4 protein n=1 Tax=Salinimicrobium catena TaxID=390640 RepID=UPI002FE49622
MSCKVGIVCNYELKEDRIGGMDRFFKGFNKELINRGAEVSWFFRGNKKNSFYKDLDVHLSGKERVEKFFITQRSAFDDFDVVITHFVELCTPFFKNIKSYGKGTYVIAVDHNPRPIPGFPIKKRLKNKIKGYLFSPYIDLFVGVSKYTVNQIIKDYGSAVKNKTRLVYNGVDTTIYKKRKKENRRRFLVASHLRQSKGIQDLIEAVNMLPDEVKKQVKIDIYGEGPLESQLKNRVMDLDLENIIKFCGSTSALPELFQNYSYLLQPTYMECFSLSILESLASNVPVITTPVGGNKEIIKENENGFIFEAGDVQALSQILKEVVQKERSINSGVYEQIESDYNLNLMVQNHIELLPCI